MKKLTQKKTAFYLLWQAHKENPDQFLPAWKFVGEVHVKEIDAWYFMSYKGPTNGLAIYQELYLLGGKNETLIERKEVIGKTGARYYAYRIRPDATPADVDDNDLRSFAELLEMKTVEI